MRLATSEYLHCDWRFMQAMQTGLPRSHWGAHGQPVSVLVVPRTRAGCDAPGARLSAHDMDGALGAGLTLVLRSTHSSQLSVGLLRFCFFLGGAVGEEESASRSSSLKRGCGSVVAIWAFRLLSLVTACASSHWRNERLLLHDRE